MKTINLTAPAAIRLEGRHRCEHSKPQATKSQCAIRRPNSRQPPISLTQASGTLVKMEGALLVKATRY